jgi:hypothetical protein
MELIVRSTDKVTQLDGVPVRVWEGMTTDGQVCLLMVHRVVIPTEETGLCSIADVCLREQAAPQDWPGIERFEFFLKVISHE